MVTFYRTKIQKTEVDVSEITLPKPLKVLAKEFLASTTRMKLPTLAFLIDKDEKRAVFYTIEFEQEYDDGKYYSYIYFSCRVLDYTREGNELIETHAIAETEFDRDKAELLYDQLKAYPCFSFEDLIASGFKDLRGRGYSVTHYTIFKEKVQLLNKKYREWL